MALPVHGRTSPCLTVSPQAPRCVLQRAPTGVGKLIGPIFPIGQQAGFAGLGSIGPPGIVPAFQSDSAASPASSSRSSLDSLGGAGILGNSLAIAEVFEAVSDLLAGIGGGLEDDQVLQALIALLILMALLQGSLDASGSQQSGQAGLPASRGGSGIDAGTDPLLIAFSYTRTTITFEQTSITSTFQSPADSAASFDSGQLDTFGGSFDTFA